MSSIEKLLEGKDIEGHFEKRKRLSKVHVRFPKFKIESTLLLNEVLKGIGMTEMYKKPTADFSGIANTKRNLYVSEVNNLVAILIFKFIFPVIMKSSL